MTASIIPFQIMVLAQLLISLSLLGIIDPAWIKGTNIPLI